MSDEPSRSQRAAWNNDGMDPDWKPSPQPERKSEPLEKLKALIRACEPIAKAARSVPIESPKDGTHTVNWYKIVMSSSVWNALVKAFDEVALK